ncbi:hypothetical protein PG995_005481 [Apiospora arundinis]
MCSQDAERLVFGNGNTEVDPHVFLALPTGCRVISTQAHGVSYWAQTGKIEVELPDDTHQSFFIKVVSGEIGLHMVKGEFESMKAIHALQPEFAPVPIAHGSYQSIPNTHFFLCEFREMREEVTEPRQFGAQLAALHQGSQSPNGKFGFHTTTYSGNLPQATDWEGSWEVFFTKSLKQALQFELEAKGPIPIHGDLWYANSGIDVNTGQCLVFDACCFYAHNEYEFGQWMPTCNKFGDEYLAAYHSYVHRSDPIEDYQGRLDLYKLRFNTHVSALFRDNPNLRDQMLGDIRDLVARYGSHTGTTQPPQS